MATRPRRRPVPNAVESPQPLTAPDASRAATATPALLPRPRPAPYFMPGIFIVASFQELPSPGRSSGPPYGRPLARRVMPPLPALEGEEGHRCDEFSAAVFEGAGSPGLREDFGLCQRPGGPPTFRRPRARPRPGGLVLASVRPLMTGRQGRGSGHNEVAAPVERDRQMGRLSGRRQGREAIG